MKSDTIIKGVLIMKEIVIRFDNDGTAISIYNEDIILNSLGKVNINRASYVEPNENGEWIADMSPIKSNIILGPFKLRSEALKAEINWLNQYLFNIKC